MEHPNEYSHILYSILMPTTTNHNLIIGINHNNYYWPCYYKYYYYYNAYTTININVSELFIITFMAFSSHKCPSSLILQLLFIVRSSYLMLKRSKHWTYNNCLTNPNKDEIEKKNVIYVYVIFYWHFYFSWMLCLREVEFLCNYLPDIHKNSVYANASKEMFILLTVVALPFLFKYFLCNAIDILYEIEIFYIAALSSKKKSISILYCAMCKKFITFQHFHLVSFSFFLNSK